MTTSTDQQTITLPQVLAAFQLALSLAPPRDFDMLLRDEAMEARAEASARMQSHLTEEDTIQRQEQKPCISQD